MREPEPLANLRVSTACTRIILPLPLTRYWLREEDMVLAVKQLKSCSYNHAWYTVLCCLNKYCRIAYGRAIRMIKWKSVSRKFYVAIHTAHLE
jgi:hypothetical protein